MPIVYMITDYWLVISHYTGAIVPICHTMRPYCPHLWRASRLLCRTKTGFAVEGRLCIVWPRQLLAAVSALQANIACQSRDKAGARCKEKLSDSAIFSLKTKLFYSNDWKYQRLKWNSVSQQKTTISVLYFEIVIFID